MREYKRARDYERDLRLRRADGWRVVSVLQRPGSGFPRAEIEYLVTYQRTPDLQLRSRPLDWLRHPHLPRSRTSRWLWIALGLLLVLLLAYGLLTFFTDPI
ncbi:MAG TPA: hypothetical protein VFX49_13725 [Chloroflexota bacterium]|nr:hypothetical protein [Chloroflexota bacterium]